MRENPILFDAVLTPRRGPGPPGFAFFLVGAWPVAGFFGLDAALVYLAFRLARAAYLARG